MQSYPLTLLECTQIIVPKVHDVAIKLLNRSYMASIEQIPLVFDFRENLLTKSNNILNYTKQGTKHIGDTNIPLLCTSFFSCALLKKR